MAASIMSTAQRQKFKDSQEVDLAYSVPGLGRFRCNVFQQRGTIGMRAPRHPGDGQDASTSSSLPPVLKKIAEEERGLVLVTGTTGSGKSTTLAGMIDHINKTRTSHIITIEDPIEYLHRDNQCDHQPARDRRRHAVVRLRAAQRAAPGPGRHPGRRNARHGNDRDRAARRRDRPPGVLDAAHARRDRNHQPHHLGLPAAPAEADPPAAGHRCCKAAVAQRLMPARRRPGPRARRRSAGRHPVHQGLHRRQGQDAPDSGRDRAGHVAVRDADVRPVDLRPVLSSSWSPTKRPCAGRRTWTSSSCGSRASRRPPTSRATRWPAPIFGTPAAAAQRAEAGAEDVGNHAVRTMACASLTACRWQTPTPPR